MSNAQEILDKMKSLIAEADLVGKSDHQVIEEWQAAQGIKPDGILGPVTARQVEAPRVCGVKDRLAIGGQPMARWDHTKWNGRGTGP